MNLYASIARRKSCRKYDPRPLGREILEEIGAAVGGFTPLLQGAPLTWRFTERVKGPYRIEAPHYLIIGGQGRAGEAENAGFLFERLALWLDAKELGCVWLGASRDAEPTAARGDIIAIALGRPAEPIHRAIGDFKRKPIGDITNAPDDPCVRAARLAPSGMNTQPWYFDRRGDETLVYRQRLKPPISLLYRHTSVDVGIALCHYALACEEFGIPFRFARAGDLPDRAGYIPFGVIT